jgi:hypothetical protein
MQRVIPDNTLQAVRTRLLEEIKATRKRINPVLHPLTSKSDSTPYGPVSKHDS